MLVLTKTPTRMHTSGRQQKNKLCKTEKDSLACNYAMTEPRREED